MSPKQLLPNNREVINKIAELDVYNKRNFNELESTLYNHLRDGDKTLDELSVLMNKKTFELVECITMLEFEGVVKFLTGDKIRAEENI